MAKSLRSKWKRKMKAEKRVRYAAKELIQLKNTLKKGDGNKLQVDENLVTMKNVDSLKEEARQKKDKKAKNEATMEVDGQIAGKKKITDENGQYPEWMNQRAINKYKSKNGKGKKKKRNKGSSW